VKKNIKCTQQNSKVRFFLVSDSTTSISCAFVVQQVVRLVVRLADCCTTCCAFVVQHVVQHVVRHVVQHVVRQIHNKTIIVTICTYVLLCNSISQSINPRLFQT